MKTINFIIIGEPAAAREVATSVLTSRSFRINWTSEFSATAERGSKVGNALAGALAQYYKVGVSVTAGAPGQTVLRVQQLSSGAMGSVVGVIRTKAAFGALRKELEAALTGAGVLVTVSES
jgi:hypothetical protein